MKVQIRRVEGWYRSDEHSVWAQSRGAMRWLLAYLLTPRGKSVQEFHDDLELVES